MNHRIDSAQLASFAGTVAAWTLANYDRLAAAVCAAVGIGYTLWKWHRDIRRDRQDSERPIRRLHRDK